MLAFEQPDEPTCRTASVSDLDAISFLEVAVFGHTSYPYFVLRQLFELHGANWTVAEEAGAVCGYVLTAIGSERTAWFLGFAVAEEFRSRGYGRSLLQRTIDACRKMDVNKILLTVDPKNVAAYKLFDSFGFELHEKDDRYFGDGVPRHVLILRLRAGDTPRLA